MTFKITSQKTGETEILERDVQIEKLNNQLAIKARIECCICGESWEGDTFTSRDAHRVVAQTAEYFYKAGWREKSSGKLQLIGAMCPECCKSVA